MFCRTWKRPSSDSCSRFCECVFFCFIFISISSETLGCTISVSYKTVSCYCMLLDRCEEKLVNLCFFLTFGSLLCVACVSVCFVCLFCNKSNWMHCIKVRETVWFAFFISCVVHEKQPQQQQQQQKSYWHENASISSIPLLLMVCLCALCVLTIICARNNLIHEPSGYVSYLPKIQVNWISWQQ